VKPVPPSSDGLPQPTWLDNISATQRRIVASLTKKWSWKSKPVANGEDKDLPIQSSAPPLIDIDGILRYSPRYVHARLKELLGWIHDPRFYLLVERLAADMDLDMSDRDASDSLSEGDFDRLIAVSLLEVTKQMSESLRNIPFAVAERIKRRRRFILWPRVLIQVLERHGLYKSKLKLPNLRDVGRTLAKGPFVGSADLTASFNQVPLKPSVRGNFAFRVRKRILQPTRLPMGFPPSPEIMQLLVESLADVGVPGIRVFVWIDNVCFVGSELLVREAMAQFKQRCRDCNVTLNEDDFFMGTTGSFVGIQFSPGEYCLTQKTVDKVHSAWKQCADDSCTIQQFAEAIGLLVYASSLLGVDLADFYPAFKCYRRRLAAAGKQQVSPQDKARIWTSVKSNLDQWFQRVATNTPVVPSDDDVPRVVLFTDASNMGYGAVLISEDGTVKYFGKHWSAAVQA
jgi:hypothetical protein